MMSSLVKGQRLIALFLLGCLLFNYPLLYLFNSDSQIFGVPLLYAYIFAAWALLIVLMAWVVERTGHKGSKD
jgi:predicted permease